MHDNLINQGGLKTMWQVFCFRLHYCPSVLTRILQSKKKVLDSPLTLIPLVLLPRHGKNNLLEQFK